MEKWTSFLPLLYYSEKGEKIQAICPLFPNSVNFLKVDEIVDEPWGLGERDFLTEGGKGRKEGGEKKGKTSFSQNLSTRWKKEKKFVHGGLIILILYDIIRL